MSYRIMRHLLIVFALLCVSSLYAQTSGQQSRLLLVEDAETTEPIIGAHILIGQSAYTTNERGHLDLSKVRAWAPQTRVRIRSIGYQAWQGLVREVSQQGEHFIIRLKPDMQTLSTLMVSSTRRTTSTNAVSSQISSDAIARSIGSSLANVLQRVSGVSMLSSGTTVAKPVIQGMYGNRILIVNNGVRQSGQQWGDDHAPELDLSSSHSVQVVKGADAVRYGAEALGGIILMEQRRLPFGHDRLTGSLGSLYASNGHRSSSNLSLEGAFPFAKQQLAYRVQGSYTHAGDRSTAEYLLNNTGVREQNFALTLGWTSRGWTLEAMYSRYDSKGGILRSAQLRNRDQLQELLNIGQPLYFTPFSRKIDYPYHRVVHHLASLKALYDSPWGKFSAQSSWQRDDREEYSIRRNNNSYVPTLSLSLTSLQQLLRWEHDYAETWHTEAGAHFVYTNNHNNPGTGVVPVIPNYIDYTLGLFAVQKYQRRRWGAEAGLRIDRQLMKALGYNIFGELYGDPHHFTNVTYSLGAHWRPTDRWAITSNLGLAWRAPGVHELYSEGQQHGSATYVIGKPDLKSELSHKWITSVSYRSRLVNLQLDGYLQWIKGYIYDEPTKDIRTTLSGDYPIFRYKQSDAFFRGVDLDLSVTPIHQLTYKVISSAVWANERLTGRYFPYIPAWRIDQELSVRPQWSFLPNLELTIKHRFVDKQRRFDPATDLTNSPPAYNLFGFELRHAWSLGATRSLELNVSGDNVLNRLYKDYTNRARYYAHDAGRDIQISLRMTF